jgi:putative flippase GtrA
MNYPRIALAGMAAWLASIALGYLIHDVWLFRLYQANAWAFRRPDDVAELVPIGLAAQLLGSLAFALAYAKGYEHNREASGIAQGIRFGLIIAIIVDGFAVVWNYVAEPIAARLGLLQILGVIGQFGLCGAIVGLIYHPSRVALPRTEENYDLRG